MISKVFNNMKEKKEVVLLFKREKRICPIQVDSIEFCIGSTHTNCKKITIYKYN
jgi:hypothetical protein